jgi:uncharacterized OB-fold protein
MTDDPEMDPDLFPRPAPGPLEKPFWDWCREGELRLQRCLTCGAWRHLPRARCAACRGADLSWEAVSGRGTVWSYTVCYLPVLPAFTGRVPYNAVVVKLREGPYLVSNLVDCRPDELEIGMEVEVVMVPVDAELTIPQFRRITGS